MLHVVPFVDLSPEQTVIERIKKAPRPSGMIQCARCGGRTMMTTVNGAFVKNGRKQGGTVIDKDICYHCHQQGIFTQMLPEIKRII